MSTHYICFPGDKKFFFLDISSSINIFAGALLFIVLGFNDMSILVGHNVSSPREREKRDGEIKEMERY